MRWTHGQIFRTTRWSKGSTAGKAGLLSDQVPSSPYLHDSRALPQLFPGKPAFLQDESGLPREKTPDWNATGKGDVSWTWCPYHLLLLLTCKGAP